MSTKICTLCKDEKDIDEFYRRQDSKGGRMSRCKECHNKGTAIHRQSGNYRLLWRAVKELVDCNCHPAVPVFGSRIAPCKHRSEARELLDRIKPKGVKS